MRSAKGAPRAPVRRRAETKVISAARRVRGATVVPTSNAATKSAAPEPLKTATVIDEDHPTGPFVHAECRVLLCGTFPPVKRSIRFYYPNANNDMWKVLGLVLCGDANAFYTSAACTASLPPNVSKPSGGRAPTRALDEARILSFVRSQAVGFFDVCRRVRRHRGTSADDNIEALERMDVVRDVLSHAPYCAGIITTGTLALKMLLDDLAAHGTFRASGGEPVEAVLTTRQGRRQYNLPPIGGKLNWIPCETCAFRSTLSIHRGPSTSRALPLKLEDKTRHYRRAFAEHLTLPLASVLAPVTHA
ncbi:hypothetical protein LSCM1_01670 [Leishmania martiniquensis]|uniref:Uracil-DNA glycosylase-like domain-containing protein n=1 Tax=Leishmania martiniquensis TaxID=1580590 RepID=A0A836H3X9_9TRYP|nr:hypothetical protein LSCM1_01670 [Leishmania martiniquensis]